jgi:hypothetical protein
MSLPEDEYVAEKRAWCERLAESAVRHVPDFRGSTVDTDVFTPRTIKKFTGHDGSYRSKYAFAIEIPESIAPMMPR